MAAEKDRSGDYSSLMEDANAFHQSVRLAAVQIAGLRPEELEQALAYELEPVSGIPATEAEITYKPISDPDPTVRVFDVVVRRRRKKGGVGSLDKWMLPAVVFGIVLVAAVVADWAILSHRRTAIEKSIAERRPLQAELDRLNERTRKATADAKLVRTAREAAIRAQDDVARRRVAHVQVLELLAETFENRAVVTSLESGKNGDLSVRAVSGSSDLAALVMRDLTARAKAKGWTLGIGGIKSSDTGRTVEFGFSLAFDR